MTLVLNGTTGVSAVDGSASTPAIQGNDTNTGVFFPAADTVAVATGGSERVRVDSSGNFGIGTSSPGAKLQVTSASDDIFRLVATAPYLSFYNGAARTGYIRANSGNFSIVSEDASTAMTFYTAGNERARIDSSGNLLVGTTTSSARLTVQADSSSVQPVVFNSTAAGTGATSLVRFRRNGTNVGEIEITGSATSYVTSSDYRLKEDVQPMAGALAKVAALKPVTYKWKVDGSDGQGFIAHELQEVCPDAVSGEKDAVDEDGNIKPQGIDTSFLVATLTAAIQELNAKVESLTAEIATLKGAQA